VRERRADSICDTELAFSETNFSYIWGHLMGKVMVSGIMDRAFLKEPAMIPDTEFTELPQWRSNDDREGRSCSRSAQGGWLPAG